ncbi:MAG TPA: oligopeptide transporter, OPT family [Candidatus Krumholzibacteria bacterium]|nr:oligopeptide transporter, OPT family [Candidatus Krumholzibacteria bacterium]HPD72363.1 oligopeptide transporter, OPT family [Candidatus Krumholzibacteria bacterium]HRY40705.1 oligopeptide transporter, OPT family [Candidatus Krumholzibacteria bacterium]
MMHDARPTDSKLLPSNAYTELAPGEEYKPVVPAGDLRAEVTPWSIGVGMAMVVLFTVACSYMALRAGNAIEASIPIAILAISFGRLRAVRSTILENVMVQSVGQAAGVVAAGATFVVPAMYINGVSASWWQIFLATFIGGSLGVALIIPLRKYFVKDLHGKLPFPEATAINNILVTGESSGGGAGKILIMAFVVGALFDFCVEGLHLWNAGLSSSTLLGGAGAGARVEVQLTAIAALFGLGYIIGIRYASIIAAGSVLSMLVMVPAVYLFGKGLAVFEFAGATYEIGEMSATEIFSAFVKPVGIGAIAISGLIGILRMWKIVAGSITLGFKAFRGGGQGVEEIRTQRDLKPSSVLAIQIASSLGLGLLFLVMGLMADYSFGASLKFGVVGMVVGFFLSFLFTPVAAQAIAIVGVNPVSGMTLITVVLAIGVMIAIGLKGTAGMLIALVIGTAVCTALSTSGALISDFKIGYWLGSTPRNQEKWKYLGLAVAALVVAAVIPLMDNAYHFVVEDPATGQMISNERELPAPQANMIAAVSRGLMENPANQPWLLYGLGGAVAFMLLMAGVPMLAFALGIYLPIAINVAVLAGAVAAWIVGKTGGTPAVREARKEQGTLIASGLMAGAAIFGVITAALRTKDFGALIRYISVGERFSLNQDGELISEAAHWYEGFTGQMIGLLMLLLLAFVCFALARLGARWEMAAKRGK